MYKITKDHFVPTIGTIEKGTRVTVLEIKDNLRKVRVDNAVFFIDVTLLATTNEV
jgi:hypothetical protein